MADEEKLEGKRVLILDTPENIDPAVYGILADCGYQLNQIVAVSPAELKEISAGVEHKIELVLASEDVFLQNHEALNRLYLDRENYVTIVLLGHREDFRERYAEVFERSLYPEGVADKVNGAILSTAGLVEDASLIDKIPQDRENLEEKIRMDAELCKLARDKLYPLIRHWEKLLLNPSFDEDPDVAFARDAVKELLNIFEKFGTAEAFSVNKIAGKIPVDYFFSDRFNNHLTGMSFLSYSTSEDARMLGTLISGESSMAKRFNSKLIRAIKEGAAPEAVRKTIEGIYSNMKDDENVMKVYEKLDPAFKDVINSSKE